jgi:N-carbamoyl-L-amino-acid hydrolase
MIKVNGDRLWASLMELARIGATPHGGVRRLALSDEDRLGRDLFAKWCTDAGMSVRVDEIGNMFARREGSDPAAKTVLVGSHLDTQPAGGRFDGAYGVLAALEIVRTLNDQKVSTALPIELVSWTNEEGARFTPSMLGSAVFVGATPLQTALQLKDIDGIALGDALVQCGYNGAPCVDVHDIDSYFEAHIEQGPILEKNGTAIGVVTGGQAVRWLDVTVTGSAAHAGTTPMAIRKDAMFASAAMALELEALASRFAPLGLVTIGQIDVLNRSRNTIAGQVEFSVDLRHPDDGQIEAMIAEVRSVFAKTAAARGVEVAVSVYLEIPATPFDPGCIDLVERAAKSLGYSHERIVSGAGHDAIHLTRHVPAAMVFIPCVDGLSHNEAEDALPADITAGANVLINAVLSRAQVRAPAAPPTSKATSTAF